jgi:hypothetical protein
VSRLECMSLECSVGLVLWSVDLLYNREKRLVDRGYVVCNLTVVNFSTGRVESVFFY